MNQRERMRMAGIIAELHWGGQLLTSSEAAARSRVAATLIQEFPLPEDDLNFCFAWSMIKAAVCRDPEAPELDAMTDIIEADGYGEVSGWVEENGFDGMMRRIAAAIRAGTEGGE